MVLISSRIMSRTHSLLFVGHPVYWNGLTTRLLFTIAMLLKDTQNSFLLGSPRFFSRRRHVTLHVRVCMERTADLHHIELSMRYSAAPLPDKTRFFLLRVVGVPVDHCFPPDTRGDSVLAWTRDTNEQLLCDSGADKTSAAIDFSCQICSSRRCSTAPKFLCCCTTLFDTRSIQPNSRVSSSR